MDTTTIRLSPHPRAPLVYVGGDTSASPEPPSGDRSDGRSAPSSASHASAPFVLLENLENELPEAAQTNATISFWFPRQRRRDRDTSRFLTRRAPASRDSATAMQQVNIFGGSSLGLLINFAAIGYFDGLLPLLALALFPSGATQRQCVLKVQRLLLLCRLVLGLASDTLFAVTTKRRRVFMVVGWTAILVLSIVFAVEASSSVPVDRRLDRYLPLLLLLPVGHTFAGVSADALMVEYAHKEDAYERGCIQMLLLATRLVGELIGRSTLSTGTVPSEDADCHGEIDCLMPLQFVFVLAACVAGVALVFSLLWTHIPTQSHQSLAGNFGSIKLTTKLRHVWTFHAHSVYILFVAYGLLQAATVASASPSQEEIARDWLALSYSSRWVSDGVNRSAQMVAALLMMSLWRNTNWRKLTLALVVIHALVAGLPVAVLVLQHVTHSDALFLASHHVGAFAAGLLAMVRVLIATEMAMPSMEATGFTLTTSAFDVGTIVGSFVSKELASALPAGALTDSPVMRWATTACVIVYAVQLVVNTVLIRMLPRQKAEIHEQRERDERTHDAWVAGFALAMVLLLIVAMVGVQVYALVAGTAGVPWTHTLLLDH